MAKAKPRVIERTFKLEENTELPVRPFRTLDEILGQDRAIGLLRAAAAAGRVHHAWIFAGPPGVGKFASAVAFAALLLDPTTEPDLSGKLAPDPDSHVQRLIREGAHPDLHIICKELAVFSSHQSTRDGKQRVMPIEVIKEFLLDPASRTRVLEGKTRADKVFIVDEAEFLQTRAQDAMLKTLEEPPPGTVFILVTAGEDRMSPTVRSRCQRVVFAPLDDKAMRKWIDANLEVGDAKQRDWLIRFSGGSPGWAASAVEHGLYAWHEQLGPMLEQIDRGRWPATLGSTIAKLVSEQAEAWVKSHPGASKEAANVAWAGRMLAYIAEHERLAMRAAAGSPEAAEARARAIDLLAAAERQMAQNVTVAFVMENLSAQFAASAVE